MFFMHACRPAGLSRGVVWSVCPGGCVLSASVVVSSTPTPTPPPPPPQAQDHNKSGDYEAARSSGKFALGFNVLAFVSGPIVYIAVVIILIVYYAIYNSSVHYH